MAETASVSSKNLAGIIEYEITSCEQTRLWLDPSHGRLARPQPANPLGRIGSYGGSSSSGKSQGESLQSSTYDMTKPWLRNTNTFVSGQVDRARSISRASGKPDAM